VLAGSPPAQAAAGSRPGEAAVGSHPAQAAAGIHHQHPGAVVVVDSLLGPEEEGSLAAGTPVGVEEPLP
jgi:hypothetical protein